MKNAASSVRVPVNGNSLEGSLLLPEEPRGLVLFAHGSGSSRFSPRNQYVASYLSRAGLATLLLDLLTADEEEEDERTQSHRFNIRLLAERVAATIDWARGDPRLSSLPIGLFGASTGAAAALVAAAARPDEVGAIVSRGGRPDLAGDALGLTFAPCLFLVGGRDPVVEELNREAVMRLQGDGKLVIIQRAGHLFESPGSLEEVAKEASSWFLHYLRPSAAAPQHP